MKTEKHGISIAPLITEAERVISEAIKHFGLKTNPADILITIQTKGRKQAIGWFWAERWKCNKSTIHEINMSAECLQDKNMGELLLHELAHAENKTLDIRDCANRIHNKHFKTMAERLGLKVHPRDKAVGYGYTDLDKPAEEFLVKIKFKHKLFTMARLTPTTRGAGPGSRLLKLECPNCGYVVRTTQKWLDTGLPSCHCGHDMEPAL